LLVDTHCCCDEADLRYTASDAEGIHRTLSGLKFISFPSIRTWRLAGEIELLTSLDLGNADDLTFQSINYRNRFFAAIPSQLTELELSRATFAIESLPGGRRHSLPRLVGLTLVDVIFIGPMSDHFHCPKLRHLDYSITSHSVSSHVTPIQEFLNEAFCREASALIFIALEGITLDDALVRTLASCPTLHELEIVGCHLEGFIPSFLERLQDPKYLPRLGYLSIEKSWSGLDLSHSEFVAQCRSRRSKIYISGDT
jgi:hypothetical protein